MGKKNSRAKQKKRELSKKWTEDAALILDQRQYESKPDEALFVLDNSAGDQSNKIHRSSMQEALRLRAQAEKKKRNKRRKLGENEERLVQRLLEKHDPSKVKEMAKANKKNNKGSGGGKRMAGGRAQTDFDLWGDDRPATDEKSVVVAVPSGKSSAAGTSPVEWLPKKAQAATTTTTTTKERKKVGAVAVDPALPGQSYCPDEAQRQDALGEALAIELRRQEGEAARNAPIGGPPGLSQDLKTILRSDDTETSDDDEDIDEIDDMVVQKKAFSRDKLTRTDLNRRRRHRATLQEHAKLKQQKRFLGDIANAKQYIKELRREEKEHSQRKEQIQSWKDEQEVQNPIGRNVHEQSSKRHPISAPSLPVPLLHELQKSNGNNHSLRTVHVKGSLLTDRIESMAVRGMLSKHNVMLKDNDQERKQKHVLNQFELRGKKRRKPGREEYVLM